MKKGRTPLPALRPMQTKPSTLERNLRPNLNVARIIAEHLVELVEECIARDQHAVDAGPADVHGAVEPSRRILRMVQGVEHIHADLELAPLANCEVLLDRDVEAVDPRRQ